MSERERPSIKVELPRCPFCHENVQAEEAKHGCPDCMAWHHEGCWTEGGEKCAACGRGRASQTAEANEAPREEIGPELSLEKKLFFLLGAIAVIAVPAAIAQTIHPAAGLIGGIFGVLLLLAASLRGDFVDLREKLRRRRRTGPKE